MPSIFPLNWDSISSFIAARFTVTKNCFPETDSFASPRCTDSKRKRGFFLRPRRKKEAKAIDVLDVYTSLLAEMFYNIQTDYATDGVILSGGVLKSAPLFIDELKRKTDALTEKYALKNVLFRFAQFDQDAGLFGGYASANRL